MGWPRDWSSDVCSSDLVGKATSQYYQWRNAMKTFYAIIASLLLASGSSVMAQTGTTGTTGETSTGGMTTDSATVPATDREFSELDKQDEGYIDQQAADEAGITTDEFQQMDSDSDGRVTEEEFDQHKQESESSSGDDSGWFN